MPRKRRKGESAGEDAARHRGKIETPPDPDLPVY